LLEGPTKGELNTRRTGWDSLAELMVNIIDLRVLGAEVRYFRFGNGHFWALKTLHSCNPNHLVYKLC
jgi:hypothetical protein